MPKKLTHVQLNPKRCSDLLLRDYSSNTYQRIPAPILLDEDSRLLAESFRELLASVAIERKRGDWAYELTMAERGSRFEGDYDFVVTNEFALSFFNSYKVLSVATGNIYRSGLDTGKSLLLSLNNGLITMNDFNENIQK
jgi:NADPH:quinone reductase-like Zn-dependent oxidoreductase